MGADRRTQTSTPQYTNRQSSLLVLLPAFLLHTTSFIVLNPPCTRPCCLRVLQDYLERNRIDFVAHDAIPYKDTTGSASNSSDVYHHIKQKGMFLETQRTEGLSTSDLIVRIIRDYDDYVIRNLDRGYSKEELNVGKSWQVRARFHQKQKQFQQSLDKMKSEQKRAEDAVIAFIREFNPRYLKQLKRTRSRDSIADMTEEPHNSPDGRDSGGAVDGEAGAGGEVEEDGEEVSITAVEYYDRLKETLPSRSAGLVHHSAGLCWAVMETTGYLLSYLNPFSYFQSPSAKKKD